MIASTRSSDAPLVDRLLESLDELKQLAEQTRGQLLEGGLREGVPEGARAVPAPPVVRLSRRERQVLQLLADGLNDREIAAELEISIETVRTHIRRLRRKLGATNRATAVARGLRRGLIT